MIRWSGYGKVEENFSINQERSNKQHRDQTNPPKEEGTITLKLNKEGRNLIKCVICYTKYEEFEFS